MMTPFAALLSATALLSPNATTANDPIPYAHVQRIDPDDSPERIAEKAAKVLPRANQSAWMRLERTFFIHFGPNTFNGVEWGSGRERADLFNPTAFDADQWMKAIQRAGGKLVVLVSKHHEGYCLWPTRYTKHSVARSPWRAGKGDVVREVAQAARKRGIKLAVYLSPADLYQLKTNPTNPAGYYGNGSEKKPSMIPTVPEKFHSEPHVGRPVKNLPKFVYTVDDYNRYFLNQLYELLTEYGEIDEVWFDGANPDPSVRQSYDYLAWYDLIYKLQPNAVIFGKGPDARWVGNEGGYGRETEWSVIPLPVPPDQFTWPDMTDGDLGSREKLKPGSYLWWYPAEVNTPILHGWFWAKGKEVKPASELIDYFYRSVGRNGNMLLNLSPDTRGLIPDDQLQALDAMSETINATFAKDLAEGAKLDTDTAEPDHPAAQALDASLDTWWEAAKGARTATLTLRLPRQTTFDVVSLQEAVDRRGQRIESFEIDHWDGTQWVALDRQTTVGYRRILRIKPVTSDRLRIRITGARLEPTIARLSLYRQAAK